ncbi:hypothetical protein H0H81_002313 [Sphagnurus paluster]|uniref:Asl1-like glycosyl hydrolase catalytic domain-containing protein n=1 Tax=Sphagnurus paluster TaxID=117069 RepID=A0A9P7G266_9AGAR|nr:hypothetical protein H0H81_002313 [Sphagnurus paluster]
MQIHLTLYFLVLSIFSCLAAKNPKRGLAFADGANPNDIKVANTSSSIISWHYDWAQSPPNYLAQSQITYIPMQWGTNGIESFAAKAKASGAKTILGFNEPDFQSQSNIDPVRAAQLWKQYIQPLSASGIRLGAPAITNAPSGRPWMASFLSTCTGCTIDFIPFHWYGEGLGNFYDYIWQVHGQFPQYPLWITEFASTSSDDADWIQGYAWFGFFRKEGTSHYNLLETNGQLNALGKAYVNNA